MTPASGATPGAPAERGSDGPAGVAIDSGSPSGPVATPVGASAPMDGGGAMGSGPTGAGTFPDAPAASTPGRSWTRSDESQRAEFGAFLDDLSELARGGSQSDLRGELERRVSRARHRMGAALDQGREMTVRARDQMSRGIDHSRDAVSERPLSYLAMAMVGGLLIGLLLSRRD
jgi:ElaB/YqjD/DUF883 family membrane-anchored ribosome-binding protein